MFPVSSTSTETREVARIVRVLERAKVARLIAGGGVFVCKHVAGSETWSQHSWGNAIDLFPASLAIVKPEFQGDVDDELGRIADEVVRQAVRRTPANRLRPIPVSQVIDHNGRRIWEPATGWRRYDGLTGAHVHVSGAPLRSGTPPCAS